MNVLILTAATGGGHIRASNALKNYFKEKDKAINVNVVDTFKYINPLLDKTVSNGYLYLAKKTPKLYGKLYKLSNDKPMMMTDKELRIQRLMESRGYSREKTESIMRVQLSDKEWEKRCDALLVNNGNLQKLQERIEELLVRKTNL